jgi:hypothetical protein
LLESKGGRGVKPSGPLKEGREEEEEVFWLHSALMIKGERFGCGGAGAIKNGLPVKSEGERGAAALIVPR